MCDKNLVVRKKTEGEILNLLKQEQESGEAAPGHHSQRLQADMGRTVGWR